jgi:hypothetical protein
MKSLKFLKIMLGSIFIDDIIYNISRHFNRHIYFNKKLKIVKYRMKNFKQRKKLTSHYFYH